MQTSRKKMPSWVAKQDLPVYETGDEKNYKFLPFCGQTIRFWVQAAHDCHMCFTTCDGESDNILEVFIGGWEGEHSAIRYNKGDDLTKQATPEILSADEMREFWITFSHQDVKVGKGGENELPFMCASLPEEFCGSHFGYSTGYGASGAFKFAKDIELKTEDELKYHFEPLYGDKVTFSVCCEHDAHVCLTQGPNEDSPMLELFLGGWENQFSALRKNNEDTVVKVETPDELCDHHKGYSFSMHMGKVTVTREGEAEPFITWEDPEPFKATHFGYCTGWGATGCWKLHV